MKKIISIALLCVVCITLCACGISRSKAVGTWKDTYTYNGSEFSVTLILSEDGEYIKTSFKDGTLNSMTTGDWRIVGGKVHCTTDVGSIEYKYRGNKLVNGEQRLEKW